MSDASDSFSYTAELRRKTLHLLALIIPLGMWWVGNPLALYVLGAGSLLAVSADVIRAHSPAFNEWIRWIFGSLMRKEELPEVGERVIFNGATSVLVGAALLTLIFPLRVAVPILTMTMLADAAAALVGRQFGRHNWGSLAATVEGSTAFVVTGLLVVVWFPDLSFGVAAAGVLGAAAIEAPTLPINDNVRVPLVGATIVVVCELVFLNQSPHLFAGLPF